MIDAVGIGQRIRYYRLQNEWTMSKLSDETGISERHLGHIERGERSCSLPALVQIASAFRIPVGFLLIETSESDRELAPDEYCTLFDCSQEEASIIIKNMRNLKKILRNYTIK